MWMSDKEKISLKRIFLQILSPYLQMLLSLESKSCLRKEKHFLRLVYVFWIWHPGEVWHAVFLPNTELIPTSCRNLQWSSVLVLSRNYGLVGNQVIDAGFKENLDSFSLSR